MRGDTFNPYRSVFQPNMKLIYPRICTNTHSLYLSIPLLFLPSLCLSLSLCVCLFLTTYIKWVCYLIWIELISTLGAQGYFFSSLVQSISLKHLHPLTQSYINIKNDNFPDRSIPISLLSLLQTIFFLIVVAVFFTSLLFSCTLYHYRFLLLTSSMKLINFNIISNLSVVVFIFFFIRSSFSLLRSCRLCTILHHT